VPEYRIQRCLGRGGFGEVYKAVMSRGNGVEMDVAIKVLRSDLDPSSQGIQRLRDEGRLLGRMTHPSILRVYDLVVIEGHAALVSEYVAGDDLSRIFREEVVPRRAAFEIVAQVAAALDAAWSHPSVTDGKPLHLVHRDVKPDNVRIDPFGGVKLLDFGIAQASRVRREAHTSVNTIMGSTQYLSPERLVQQEVGPEADVFALGCTAFEVLAGEPLFLRKSMRQMYLLMVDQARFETFVRDRCDTHRERMGEAGVALVTDLTAFDKSTRPTAGDIALRCDTVADSLTGPTLRSWCRTRTWSPPPDMTGPLEGLTFVVHTGARASNLPPTATARHRLPTSAELAEPTPPPAPERPEDEAETPAPTLRETRPTTGDAGRTPQVAAPPLPPAPHSGPSPWTEEEREALVDPRRLELSLELPAPEDGPPTAELLPPPGRELGRDGELELDTGHSTDPSVDPGPASAPEPAVGGVPDDLPEPISTARLPVLERQRSPELWPLPMVTVSVRAPASTEEIPTANLPETGEVTVRLKRVPRKRADGSVAPRRRLVRDHSGTPVREVTRELPLADALGEPTLRMLPGALAEVTQSGPDRTWPGSGAPGTGPDDPGAEDERTASDPRRTPAPVVPRPDNAIDEVPPSPPDGGDELLLEALEATTGARQLPSGLHHGRGSDAATRAAAEGSREVAAELPTIPEPPSEDAAARHLDADPPTQPDSVAPRTAATTERPEGRQRPPAPGSSLAPLLASAGGLAGLAVGVLGLLLVLAVVWFFG
jgi:serine/threonine protein kinase